MNQSMEVTGTKFKYRETTKQIKMQFFKPDGTSYYPDSSHNFQAKVANSTGIVGTYPVVVQGSNIVLSTSKLTELTPDDYQMEVWETYTDDAGPETTIYPSPDACIYFTIEENIDGKSGTLIKELGFQDVVNQAVEQAGLNLVVTVQSGDPGTQATVKQTYANGKNNVSLTIPKGEKGDQGPQGPAGPQGPQGPASYLHVAYANSADGSTDFSRQGNENLLTRTTNALATVTNATGWSNNLPYIPTNRTDLSGDTYTASVWISPIAHDAAIAVRVGNSNSAINHVGNTIKAGTSGYSTVTVGVPNGSFIISIFITFTAVQTDSTTVSYKELKLEKGATATDWCPAPADNNPYKYIGTYTDNLTTGSKNPSDYTWSAFLGPQGPKGDKGDPAVPAIIGGRNYILNSGNIVASQPNNPYKYFLLSQNLSDFAGQQITLSLQVDVDNAQPNSNGQNRVGAEFSYATTDGKNVYVGVWKNLSAGQSFHGRISQAFVISPLITPQSTFTVEHHLYAQTSAANAKASFPKLEIGSVATDWSPNPSEILTQSDYAKIQAAIVALGGSL